MVNFLRKIYTGWCAIVFIGIFLCLFPAYFIIIQSTKWHKYSFYLNRIWAKLALWLVQIKVEITGRENINTSTQNVYCANHFSLLDILSFGFAPQPILFVGKASLAKLPLFGYMFRKIHVTVDRNSIKDSYNALNNAMIKIGSDKSLVMFPEGGVYTKNPPIMVRFKDGAFRAAIEKQIPIVPVSLPDNWIILPDEKIPLIRRRKMRMKFHKPISTLGLEVKDIDTLKHQVFDTIQKDLDIANSR